MPFKEDIPDIYMVEIGVQNTNACDKDGQDSVVEILGDRIVVAYNVTDDIGLGDITVDDNNGVDNIVADTNIHGDNNVLGDTIEVDNNEANTNMDMGKGPSIKEHIFLKQKTLNKGKGIMIEGKIMVNKKKKHVFRGSGVVIRENENPSMDNDSESDINNYDIYHKFDAIESDSEEYDSLERSLLMLPNSKNVLLIILWQMDSLCGFTKLEKRRLLQNGLIEAVKDVMPHEEHSQCARHSYKGFCCKKKPIQKSPKVPGRAGRPEKKLVDVADEVVVLEFVSNEINDFHMVASSNHVVFNNGSRIDLGSNWNKNKMGAKSAVV
ncbi:hypothetical protein Tco_0313606 [Tanacetum coccineum]